MNKIREFFSSKRMIILTFFFLFVLAFAIIKWNTMGNEVHNNQTTNLKSEEKIEEKIEEETLAFETIKELDDSLNEGETKVKQKGKNGLKKIVIKQVIKDGEVLSEEKNSEVIEEKIDEIILVGTKTEDDKQTTANNTNKEDKKNAESKPQTESKTQTEAKPKPKPKPESKPKPQEESKPQTVPKPQPKPKEIQVNLSMAKETHRLINKHRVSMGLPELKWSDKLYHYAVIRAKESIEVFSHTRPNGSGWWTVEPGESSLSAENLAHGYTSAESIKNAWVNSTGHRQNLETQDAQSMAVAVVISTDGVYHASNLFSFD